MKCRKHPCQPVARSFETQVGSLRHVVVSPSYSCSFQTSSSTVDERPHHDTHLDACLTCSLLLLSSYSARCREPHGRHAAGRQWPTVTRCRRDRRSPAWKNEREAHPPKEPPVPPARMWRDARAEKPPSAPRILEKQANPAKQSRILPSLSAGSMPETNHEIYSTVRLRTWIRNPAIIRRHDDSMPSLSPTTFGALTKCPAHTRRTRRTNTLRPINRNRCPWQQTFR